MEGLLSMGPTLCSFPQSIWPKEVILKKKTFFYDFMQWCNRTQRLGVRTQQLSLRLQMKTLIGN